MKERTASTRPKERRLWQRVLLSAVLQKTMRYAAYFAAGLLCARGEIFGRHAPFGVAAVAGCPRSMMWLTSLGSAVGYLLPGGSALPGRYLTALALLVMLRWTLGEIGKLKNSRIFGAVITFLSVQLTGAAVAILDGASVQTWILYLAESVLGAGAVYFFHQTSFLLSEKKSPGMMKQSELTCVILTLGIAVLSLSSVQVGMISIGRVAAVLLILFSCRYGGVVGGSLSGIVAGAMFGLATSGISGISGALSFAGLIAGLFAPLGRLANAAAFVLANGIGSLQVGSYTEVMNGIYEVMAASLIFVVWPSRTGSSLAAVFRRPYQLAQNTGLRRTVISRLGVTAEALENVSDSVEAVSKKLQQVDATSMESVYQNAADTVCGKCVSRGRCWGSSLKERKRQCGRMTEALRIDGQLEEQHLPQMIRDACARTESLVLELNRNYREYLAKESAERKLQQVRSVVTGQFATTGKLLRDMATEIKLYEKFDEQTARKISELLHDGGITPIDVSCRLNRAGRMCVEIEALSIEKHNLTKVSVLRGIGRVTGREFSYPCIVSLGEKCRFQMTEKPLYKAVTGVAQHSCKNASLCGDSCISFEDGGGNQIAVLSDGMGTGGRAAVDGAMASGIFAKLVQAGVGFDCALNITNSALMVKSGAETLSTLDVAAVDLFTGEVELMKAGAPVSYIRKNKEVHRLDAVSLPVGILDEAVFCKTSAHLGDGDLLVMFSDGAVAAGEDWMAQVIRSWTGDEPSQLANQIVQSAVKYRTDGRDDDITVFVMQLEVR